MKIIQAKRKGEMVDVFVDDEDFELVSKRSWHIDRMGYARGSLGNKGIFMARYLMGATDPKIYVDHINGNPLDNRRCNLRLANNSENQANRRRHPLNKSGYRGVCWNKKSCKWQASIKHELKSIYLGMYETPEEASEAYKNAAEKIYGKFAEHKGGVE